MSFKIVLVCAHALLIQSIATQCIGTISAPLAVAPCAGAWGAPYAAEWDYAPASLAASNGPGVAVSTASPLLPAGVSVLSENAYEGILAVEGALPFLGTVAFEGTLPTAGAGVVAYSCGNGAVGITTENNAALGFVGIGPLGGSLGGTVSYGTIGAPLAAALPSTGLAAGTWGAPYAAEWAYTPAASLAASNGPGLAVSSASPRAPSGVSIVSENAYEGALAAGGAVPFLGTVTLEGALPTCGAGAVAYVCGNGAVGITDEDIGVGIGGFEGAIGYGSILGAPLGIAGRGCGRCAF